MQGRNIEEKRDCDISAQHY